MDSSVYISRVQWSVYTGVSVRLELVFGRTGQCMWVCLSGGDWGKRRTGQCMWVSLSGVDWGKEDWLVYVGESVGWGLG